MLNLNEETERLKELGNSIQNILEITKKEVAKTDSKDKSFVLNAIGSIKEKIKTGEGLSDEIQKIKNYANSR